MGGDRNSWLRDARRRRHGFSAGARVALVTGAVITLGATATSAGARAPVVTRPLTAYVTNFGDSTVTPIDVETNTPGAPIPVGDVPVAIAITPDGATAYVASDSDSVTPIDTTTNTAGPPIAVGGEPVAIAIAPDGSTAYVVTYQTGNVVPIDLATNTVGTPITAAHWPYGIAITPDGSTAYVTSHSGAVVPINLRTRKAEAPIRTPGGVDGDAIAITPDGTAAYFTNYSAGGLLRLDLATRSITSVYWGAEPQAIAISSNGATAYVAEYTKVVPVDTATNHVGTPIVLGASVTGIAVNPKGSTAYATSYAIGFLGRVTPIHAATGRRGRHIDVGAQPIAIAFTPDQAPVAAFSVSPAAAGTPTGFDGSASFAVSSPITRYRWSFGDGTSLVTRGPLASHVYASAGRYTVALTLVDASQTSTTRVFTGQTVSRNGAPSARAVHRVDVA